MAEAASGWLDFLKELILSAGGAVQDAVQNFIDADAQAEQLHNVTLLLEQVILEMPLKMPIIIILLLLLLFYYYFKMPLKCLLVAF